MKNTTVCIFSVLGGIVLGSAVALALAPKTGEEMRNYVRNFLNDEIDKWRSAYKDAMPSCDCEKK
uniref:YtxH domain-containing protein n=1 Tax=Alistipes sp. TaxID=1872444 RepID=UPI004056EEC0